MSRPDCNDVAWCGQDEFPSVAPSPVLSACRRQTRGKHVGKHFADMFADMFENVAANAPATRPQTWHNDARENSDAGAAF
jgi:hypothetical protein